MPAYAYYTPAESRQQLDRSERQVEAMAQAVNANRSRLTTPDGQRFWTDWSRFKNDWRVFYEAHQSAVGASFSADAMRGLIDRYNSLESQFTQVTGVQVPQANPEDTRAAPGQVFGGGSASLNTYLMVGAGVVGLVALAVLAVAGASIARSPAARMVSNRRRRR